MTLPKPPAAWRFFIMRTKIFILTFSLLVAGCHTSSLHNFYETALVQSAFFALQNCPEDATTPAEQIDLSKPGWQEFSNMLSDIPGVSPQEKFQAISEAQALTGSNQPICSRLAS